MIGSFRSWRRRHWTLLLVGVALVVFVSGMAQPKFLRNFGVYPIQPMFTDMVAILAAGEAAQAGWDVYASNPLDPENRPHVYGPWWLMTGKVGLVRADVWWLGPMLGVLFLAVAAAVLAPHDRRTWGAALLLLVSPPVLLGQERGNNDLVMFLIFVGAIWLVTRRSKVAAGLAGGLVTLAAALKIYPLAILPVLAVRATTRRSALGLMAGTLLVCLMIGLLSWQIYCRVIAIAPVPMTIYAHGAKLTYYILRLMPAERGWVLAGGLPVLGAVLGLGWRRRRELWRLLPPGGFSTGCYLAGALAWGFCYVATINFSYRLLLLLLPARFCLQESSDSLRRRIGWGQIGMMVPLMWISLMKERLFTENQDGNQINGGVVAWMGVGAEQALALGLFITMAIVAAGWAKRRFQSSAEAD
jgi:hypothetical protein